MDRRTYESPMDWEYQNHGPMDPSSPFVQSTRHAQEKNSFGSSSFGTFGQNPFNRTQSTPSKHLPPTTPSQPSSTFAGSPLKRTTTAPPFRNPAFTTPRKPFDIDTLSEFSAAESSPTATDVSDFQDTPEKDKSFDLAHMTITPSTMNKSRSFTGKKSGKGEIPKVIFASRDKVRKRKRYNGDKDISGYRLPYLQQDEWEESDYESDDSTFQPTKPQKSLKKHNRDGWFGSFLTTIQRHPYAPKILDYWLALAFNLFIVSGGVWILWAIVAGLRQDFSSARAEVRAEIIAEIDKCTSDYRTNKCSPIEQRLPAMYELCDQWFDCMNQNPDRVKHVSIGAKEIVQVINGVIDTMSLKTIAVLAFVLIATLHSGARLFANGAVLTGISSPHPPTPFPSHPAGEQQHMLPPGQQVYWQALQPRTPRRFNSRHMLQNDDTPETDGSPPPRFKPLTAPQTPSSRRSPSKGERGRSPTKTGSPTKKY
ncbi:Di-sulfide bridge nucleocytoplasmic transport domain-containing protein [Xylariaceae sp. FL0662B]|nr:Di-sulfide bridge nucleocytoplasmic transport domain-containing protein [Xylariaceae sp. FL0662B]